MLCVTEATALPLPQHPNDKPPKPRGTLLSTMSCFPLLLAISVSVILTLERLLTLSLLHSVAPLW